MKNCCAIFIGKKALLKICFVVKFLEIISFSWYFVYVSVISKVSILTHRNSNFVGMWIYYLHDKFYCQPLDFWKTTHFILIFIIFCNFSHLDNRLKFEKTWLYLNVLLIKSLKILFFEWVGLTMSDRYQIFYCNSEIW